MEKKLINEIFRIKLLSGYDTNSTFSENVEDTLNESRLDIFGPAFKNALGSTSKKLTVTTKLGKNLTNADDIIKAISKNLLTPQEQGRVFFAVFETTKDKRLMKELAKDLVETPSFISKYGNLDKATFKSRLKYKKKYLPDDQIDELWKATKKRKVDTVRKTKKAATAAEESSRKAKEAAAAAEEASKRAMQAAEAAELVARKAGKGSVKEAMAADPKGFYQSLKSYTIKGISWVGRRISRMALWRLAKIAGISWLVWWAFFKDDGFTLTDEDDGGGDTGGEEKKIQIGGGEITDNEGNKYKECENTYYKGCVNKKGNTDIQKAQDCLGITPNGFFNQETEDALMKKINKKSFSLSDLDDICAKSYGGGSFSA